MGLNAADGEGPGNFSVQGREEYHGETTAAKEERELGITTASGGTEGGRYGGDTDINYPEAEYGRAIYCEAADSGPMRAGHLAARRAGVLAVVGADGDRPGRSAKTGGGISSGIGDGFRGGFGRGCWRRRRRGVPGIEQVQWSRVERGGG